MQSPVRHLTRRSSYSALVSVFFAVVVCGRLAAAAAQAPTAAFSKALDAYFSEQPYRTIVLVHESMARPDTAALREASLYLLGQSFASIHLYEKAEDSLSALLSQFPNGRFAPIALRELGRIFFNLHEYAAVVNLEQTFRGQISSGAIPPEFYYLVGQSNYLLGRKQQAREPLLRVPAGTPFYPFALYTLAQVEFSVGRPDAALGALSTVTSTPGTPELLRDRAVRVTGMILYQQKRYGDSMQAYRSISQSSSLYGQSRVDLALAADAAGDSDAARQAFADAMDHADDDLIRTEARVAVGRFLNKREKPAAARTLFEQAMADLRTREGKLQQSVASDQEFSQTFAELVTFARQTGGAPRRERLAEDLQLMRGVLASVGANYEHANIPGFEKFAPKSYLFPMMQRHFHNPAIVETFVELAVECEDLKKQVATLETEIRGQADVWNANPPIKSGAVPENVKNSIPETVWLLFGNYDLGTRFYDALALNEKVDQATVIREKQKKLGETIEGIRLILFGQPRVPPKQDLIYTMESAREKIQSGTIPGMMAQKVREGFLQEWKSDLDSVTYVVDNLDLKERQMNSALMGVPLRARNVNLPVLSTMTEWLSALQQLVWKYRYIEIERDQRPWFLSGKNADVASILARMRADLDVLEARSQQVLRDVAQTLISREQMRHSLIVAQAEEGIADALFQERSQR
jgi:tetratricopeptide (TPR) repeat protein